MEEGLAFMCAHLHGAYQVALRVEVTNEMNQVFFERRAPGLGIDHLGGEPAQRLVFEARDNLVQRSRWVARIVLGHHGCETCFERCIVCDHVTLLQESVRGEELQWVQRIQCRRWYIAMCCERAIQ